METKQSNWPDPTGRGIAVPTFQFITKSLLIHPAGGFQNTSFRISVLFSPTVQYYRFLICCMLDLAQGLRIAMYSRAACKSMRRKLVFQPQSTIPSKRARPMNQSSSPQWSLTTPSMIPCLDSSAERLQNSRPLKLRLWRQSSLFQQLKPKTSQQYKRLACARIFFRSTLRR